MKALRSAAQAALERTYAGWPGRPARIEQLTTRVELDGGEAQVTLFMRDNELSWSCSCGVERCPHAQVALALLANAEPRAAEERITDIWEPPIAAAPADRRVVSHSDQPARADAPALVEVLSDL